RWKQTWDWALFIGGFVPALIFGVAVGNVLLGLPFHFEPNLRPVYTGGFFALLSPFALLCGLVSVALLVAHGAAMLLMKNEDPIAARAARYGSLAALAGAVLFAAAGVWVANGITGMRVESVVDGAAASNPLAKTVATGTGLWMHNYRAMPLTMLAPAAGLLGALLSALWLWRRKGGLAFLASATAVTGAILTVGFAIFPFLLPSSSVPD